MKSESYFFAHNNVDVKDAKLAVSSIAIKDLELYVPQSAY